MRLIFVFVYLFVAIQVQSQVYDKLSSFNAIEVFGKVNLRLEKSDCDSVFIKCTEAEEQCVKYEVKDSVLEIRTLKDLSGVAKIDIKVCFSELIQLEAGGGAKIYNRGEISSGSLEIKSKSGCEMDLLINVDTVNVVVNNGAFIRLRGRSDIVHLKTATGGDYRATELKNKRTYSVQNGGTAEINCSQYLDATVRYGATMRYVSQPQKIKRKEQLGGTVGMLEKY